MMKRKSPLTSGRQVDPETVRASISFPAELYLALEAEAKQKKVSLAWIVRDAVEVYLSDRRILSLREARK